MASLNITCAVATPENAPSTWAAMYGNTSRQARPPIAASASVTAGLKWAPLTGPNVRMSATRPAPVATVFASSAMATFPPAKRSAMIPEPTTVAKRNAVPIASDARRRVIEMSFISVHAQQQPDFLAPALAVLGPQQL